jgi:hypothetical protein
MKLIDKYNTIEKIDEALESVNKALKTEGQVVDEILNEAYKFAKEFKVELEQKKAELMNETSK